MWELVNNFLATIGLISLVITVIRIIWTFSGGSEWIDNVRIEEYSLDKDLDGLDGRYPQYYPDYPSRIHEQYITQNLFIPESTIIRKAVLKKIDEKNINQGTVLKYKKVHIFKMVTPQSPLCIVIDRGEVMTPYVIEWTIEYGGRARYYFSANLRDGNNNKSGFEYHYGFIAKIRKILELR